MNSILQDDDFMDGLFGDVFGKKKYAQMQQRAKQERAQEIASKSEKPFDPSVLMDEWGFAIPDNF